MIILGIETSCDETSISVIKKIKDSIEILSSCTFTQADIHSTFGGVVPEVASRNHLMKIEPLFNKALSVASISKEDIDLIAVTSAPGLIGALFIGVSFAKGLAYSLNKPILPIHHLSGHILSAELSNTGLRPPYTAMVVSGGHTHIYDVTEDKINGMNFKLWGRTIDDAAGEAFDKVAKMLGGPYPGGPFIEELAKGGLEDTIKFPIALKNRNDFSFSGLKTSVLTRVQAHEHSDEDIASSFQYTVAITLAEKVIKAAKEYRRDRISISGGVACNSVLRKITSDKARAEGIDVYYPHISLCNDNAAMIAYAASRLIEHVDNYASLFNLDFAAGDTMHEIQTISCN